MTINLFYFISAAFCEIFGCFGFWLYFREEKSFFWLVLGLISLITFAYLLTKVNLEVAGRIYAIYGGIYIICSFFWMIFVEKEVMNKYDTLGLVFVLFGASIIFFGNKILN